jgi:hypothetical protein
MATGKRRISSEVRALVVLAALEIAQPVGLGIVPEQVLELGIVLAAERELATDPVGVELAIDPVGVELETDPVGVELETDPVAVELAIDPVGVELETDPVAVELAIVRVAGVPGLDRVAVQDHPLDQPVPLAKTKWVTAARRRGLVPVLGAEDLVGAVETTREPAAVEAVTAWAAVA